METESVSSPAEPSKLMATVKDGEPVKSSKPTFSAKETTIAPQLDWSAFMHMQAYHHNPHFAASYPHSWVNQYPAAGSYATPTQYPGLYHPNGLHNHRNAAIGLTLFTIPEAEGKVLYDKDWEPKGKCKERLGDVGEGGRSGESGKIDGSSGIDCDLESGTASTSHDCDKGKQECPVTKKRSIDQMLADEANTDAKNTVSANYGGVKHQVLLQEDKIFSMPASNGDMGISSKGSSPASNFMTNNPNNPSGASVPVASAKMVAPKKVKTAQQIQDVPKLLDEKRRLQNKEAARRLRDRKEEQKEIEAMADRLRKETSMLTKNLARYSEMCLELKEENDGLLEELKLLYEANALSAPKDEDHYQCLQLVREENNNRNQESSSEHKSSLTGPSTPDT